MAMEAIFFHGSQRPLQGGGWKVNLLVRSDRFRGLITFASPNQLEDGDYRAVAAEVVLTMRTAARRAGNGHQIDTPPAENPSTTP